MTTLLQKTSILESSFDEEDSYHFLISLQEMPWYKYSSKDISIDDVISAIETYILLHANVDLNNQVMPKFWTPKPIGVFRYIMDSNGGWREISEFNPFDGYLVQGSYWSNGFYYIVSHKDFLIEASLFVDIHTKQQYNYQ